MQQIIAALIITSGLVFVGLSQRYDFHDKRYRIDRLTGQVERCNSTVGSRECKVRLEGTGIFKTLSSGNSE